jgi:hypothetical protein
VCAGLQDKVMQCLDIWVSAWSVSKRWRTCCSACRKADCGLCQQARWLQHVNAAAVLAGLQYSALQLSAQLCGKANKCI